MLKCTRIYGYAGGTSRFFNDGGPLTLEIDRAIMYVTDVTFQFEFKTKLFWFWNQLGLKLKLYTEFFNEKQSLSIFFSELPGMSTKIAKSFHIKFKFLSSIL